MGTRALARVSALLAAAMAGVGAWGQVSGSVQVAGSCWLQDGDCIVMPEVDCATAGGIFLTDDTTCDPGQRERTGVGACCFYTGGCQMLTPAVCAANGGDFQGENTVCWYNPYPCDDPQPLGIYDDFDDYPPATVLHGVGGWYGWDNNPAAAGVVSGAQFRSWPHSIAIKTPADAVHPLSNVEGGKWTVTAWQYMPAPEDFPGRFNNPTYFILNSYYQHGGPQFWAVQLKFNPITNLVHDDLRDPAAADGVPIVYNQWVEIRVEVDFDDNWLGWVDQYYNDQLVYSGDWIVGAIGQFAIGAIDLYGPHQYTVYYDDISVVPVTGGPGEATRPLFVGVEYGDQRSRTTDLSGFPEVTWLSGPVLSVDGAAARPDGAIYFTTGAFTSQLYLTAPEGPPVHLTTLQHATQGLAYGRGRLYGFCNYATPKGIYEINPSTGAMSLVVTTGSYLYFALDYNPVDDLVYGYTEYGTPRGLHAIDLDTGTITPVASLVPAANSSARGLACGDNTVFALTTYGQYPMFAYDLSQGPGGEWTPMPHPIPDNASTGGAAWADWPSPGDINGDGHVDLTDLSLLLSAFGTCIGDPGFHYGADFDGSGCVDLADLSTMLANFGT